MRFLNNRSYTPNDTSGIDPNSTISFNEFLGAARGLKSQLSGITTAFGVEQKLDEFIDAFSAFLKENDDLQQRRLTVAPYFAVSQ